MKSLKKFLPIIAVVLVATFFVVNAQVQPMGTDGTLGVIFSEGANNLTGMPRLTRFKALDDLIEYAEARQTETVLADSGTGIATTTWWATQAIKQTFQDAIDEAKRIKGELETAALATEIISTLETGDVFTMTLQISGNTGFNGMSARVNVPAGLRLVDITHPFTEINTNPPGAGFAVSTFPQLPLNGSATAAANVVVLGPSNFTEANADLLVYTFEVTGTTSGLTEPIMFSLANDKGPTDMVSIGDDDEEKVLDITHPSNLGRIAIIN